VVICFEGQANEGEATGEISEFRWRARAMVGALEGAFGEAHEARAGFMGADAVVIAMISSARASRSGDAAPSKPQGLSE
jgi:hypothetical protein